MLLAGIHRLTDNREIMQGFIEMEPNGKVFGVLFILLVQFFFPSLTRYLLTSYSIQLVMERIKKKYKIQSLPFISSDYIRIQVIFI